MLWKEPVRDQSPCACGLPPSSLVRDRGMPPAGFYAKKLVRERVSAVPDRIFLGVLTRLFQRDFKLKTLSFFECVDGNNCPGYEGARRWLAS